MSARDSVTVLHVSDLQFGPRHRFDNAGPLGTLLDRLEQDLKQLREQEDLRPDLVLLTGDLTELGRRSEFEQVDMFARELAKFLELPARRIVLVPGNHDINRALCEAYFRECEGNELEPAAPFWPKLRPYAEFFDRFYGSDPHIRFTEEQPWSFFEYPELGTVVAGLSSTLADSHRAQDHYGWVGEEQIRAMVERLEPYREQGFLRIAAVHHDILNPPAGNVRAEQDAKDIRRMLAPWLNILFHGHMHSEQIGWINPSVPVMCIGSAGVVSGDRPPEVPNQYQVVRLAPGRLTYGTRAYAPDQKRWVGDLRADPEGRKWLVDQPQQFEGANAAWGDTTGPSRPSAELAATMDRYRRHLATIYRRKALADLAVGWQDRDFPAGLDLLHLFVMPKLSREPTIARPRDALMPSAEPSDVARRRAALPDALPELAEEVLAEKAHPWVFVLGAPGAGKTTLTRWLVVKLGTPGETLGALSPSLVPVHIDMRRFDLHRRAARGHGYDFFDYLDDVHRELSLELRADALRALSNAGRLLWIFDGLDEVVDLRARLEYAEMIAGLRAHQGSRGVITSRKVESEQVQALFQDFAIPAYRLLDFTDEQIREFLDHWHAQAFPGAPEVAAHRRERLDRTLQGNPAMRELCRTPLLLTLIAVLNRAAQLPARRHALYERAVEWMTHQWEANKSGSGVASPFGFEDKKQFLRELAWHMMTVLPHGSGNVIQESDLLEFATQFRRKTYGEPSTPATRAAQHLLTLLRERHGILTFLGGDAYGFTHRAFLEYLAAEEAHARFRSLPEMIDLFRKHWLAPEWKEILTLICGLLAADRPEHVVEVLQGVLQELDLDEQLAVQFTAFSVWALVEAGKLNQEPVRTFALRLTDLAANFGAMFVEDEDDLLAAMRLAGENWPGASTLRARALRSTQVTALDIDMAIATQSDRAAFLEELLGAETDKSVFEQALTEAARHGAWTSDEITRIEKLAAQKGEMVEVSINCVLAASGVRSAFNKLYALMRSAHNPEGRLEAALVLVQTKNWHNETLETILAVLESFPTIDRILQWKTIYMLSRAFEENPTIRERMIAWFSSPRDGFREQITGELARKGVFQAIDVLTECIQGEAGPQAFMALLQQLAHHIPCATRSESSERVRFEAAQLISDRAILNALADSAKDATVKADALRHVELFNIRDALLRVGKMRRGWVSLSGQRVGVIEETPSGSRFTYDPEWLARADAKPISPTLPLRSAPYESEGLHPFFANLLPEGWYLDLVRGKLHIPAQDLFGVLLATCRDCIGAVEITPADEDEEAA